jgi:hypothetical protein
VTGWALEGNGNDGIFLSDDVGSEATFVSR